MSKPVRQSLPKSIARLISASDRFLPRRDAVDAAILSRDVKYDGFSSLTECRIAFTRSDGERTEVTREVHDHGHGVCVLPVDRERHVALLVRQVRIVLLANGDPDPMLLEVAAGLVDEGESPEETAIREAEEELGFRISDLQHVTTCYPTPGVVSETQTSYLASYSLTDRVAAGGGLDEEGEDIIVEEIALDELGEAVLQGKLRDAKTILLVQHLMLSEPELFF